MALDEAAGRRVTRYGHFYERHAHDSLRFIGSKVDEVLVDVGLTAQAAHQVARECWPTALPAVTVVWGLA